MIKAGDYLAFLWAAKQGHLKVLEWLEERAPAEHQAMVGANNYEAFRLATLNNHVAIVQHLLCFPGVFSYAERDEREYGATYVHPFIQEKLATLRAQRQALETRDPHAVFNIINKEETYLCFYMIRNVIRRNDPALLDDLRFLMDIPSVKMLLHASAPDNEPNELLRLALIVRNQDAVNLLLNVPAVRELAEVNNLDVTERFDDFAESKTRRPLLKAPAMSDGDIRKKLIDDLNRYIHSVDNGSRRKFTYFQERQKENRKINYHLAKNLRDALQNPDIEIAQVFQNISGQREDVRKQLNSKLIGNFLLSDELNRIIKQGKATESSEKPRGVALIR